MFFFPLHWRAPDLQCSVQSLNTLRSYVTWWLSNWTCHRCFTHATYYNRQIDRYRQNLNVHRRRIPVNQGVRVPLPRPKSRTSRRLWTLCSCRAWRTRRHRRHLYHRRHNSAGSRWACTVAAVAIASRNGGGQLPVGTWISLDQLLTTTSWSFNTRLIGLAIRRRKSFEKYGKPFGASDLVVFRNFQRYQYGGSLCGVPEPAITLSMDPCRRNSRTVRDQQPISI